MGCSVGDVSRVNAFALVSYIPGILDRFLDDLRRDLVASCTAQSHVTILPPRILEGPPDEGWQDAAEILRSTEPIEIGLENVEIFPVSHAIYLSIGQGYKDLESLHARLNFGRLHFAEPFAFHPHVTLAQEVGADRVEEVTEKARRKWAEWTSAKSFVAERLVLVQNGVDQANGCSQWIDLATCHLGHPCEPWHWSDDGSLNRTSPFGPLPSSGIPSLRDGGAGSR